MDTHFRNAICLIVDGLHLGFPGAYGNSWIESPALDQLACESVVFDRYYTNTLHLAELYREFWFGLHPAEGNADELPQWPGLPQQLAEKGYRTILLTDDPAVSLNLFAEGFTETHLIETPRSDIPADTLEQTQFFRIFATIVDLVSRSDSPYFLWCHFKGFAGPWDFPMEFREQYVDEDDPEPFPGTKSPRIDDRAENPIDPDPDVLRSVIETYAGGVTAFDESFAGLLESIRENTSGAAPLLLLAGARGFPLGEHRMIGRSEHFEETGESLLWAENVHIPLFIRFPDQFGAMVRSPALTQPNDLYATLCDWFVFPNDHPCDAIINENQKIPLQNAKQQNAQQQNAIRSGIQAGWKAQTLLPVIAGDTEMIRDRLLIFDSLKNVALVTPEWFLRKPSNDADVELFAKPDDRWEINDVADRCEHELEQMESELVLLPNSQDIDQKNF